MSIPGSYRLSFYAKKPVFSLTIYKYILMALLTDTETTIPTNWELYSSFLYPTIGTNTILFNEQDELDDGDIALCNIQFYYIPPPSGPLTLTYKSFLIFQYLRTFKMSWLYKTWNYNFGTITTSQKYNNLYTNILANLLSKLRLKYKYVYTSHNGSISSFVAIIQNIK